MLQFQLLQIQDVKEAAAIERRRRSEEERKKRIFDARARVLGVDYNELEKQIAERRQRDVDEKRLELIFHEQESQAAKISLAFEKKQKEEKRKICQEIAEFNKHYLRLEDRREYDLNDPNFIKNSLPARLDDNDPRLGPSSAQKFEGEDLASLERKKLQTEQTKAYLEQQIKEHSSAEKERKDAEDAYLEAVLARDQRAKELDELDKECRKQMLLATNRYNEALRQQNAFNKEIKKKQELEDNFAEMYNNITSDFLTENPNQTQSNLGLKRAIGAAYKGMTPEQREEIRQDQIKQIEQNKAKKNDERRLQQYWDEYSEKTDLAALRMEFDLREKQRELEKKRIDYNQKLAEEQNAYKEYLEKVVYSNKPTAAYFEQFNTTSR